MSRLRRRGLSSGRVALIISVVAMVLALAGTAFSGGSAVPGKNGVKASDIAKGAVKEGKLAANAVTKAKLAEDAVTEAKIAKGAVTSDQVFLGSVTTLNFGDIAGETCSSLTVPAAGITANDHVLVTPPPGFPDTFTLMGKPAPATNTVVFAVCNHFNGGGAVDPDGPAGSPYKLLVIN